MPHYNKVILAGHLTRDPELRFMPTGKAIAKFGIGVNRTWKDEGGNKKEEVMFCDIDVFGKTAESCAQYLKKGSAALIEGRLKLDQWDDKQSGQKRSKLGVVAETVQFLGSAESASERPQRMSREQVQEKMKPAKDAANDGQDVPF